ncbi:branched-chain amino acid ABC transporter permease [Hydrogenophaga sp. D2P1]|uniref:Branched-chain amino acid ABC transporter permease n=1 Tax=Hydrogenophaga aromaticivorans TaxID=2610898 RepID=A0A7Y8GZM7_9BURK|nr:branched-chain amino acid ABC transporter permease [Hydrogenophaga aromaticivorans]NWF47794.1 branched-chain amino acid ABC transporter permease [Hydrogenophaga aromaticivorans]
MQIIIEQILNALQMGVLLFLISSGLSLIFGLMHVVNLAHGALYMVGAYFGITIAQGLGNFYLAVLLAPLLTAVVGVLVERTLLSRTYGRGMYPQVLLTLGLVFCFDELVRIVWGAPIQTLPLPPGLAESVTLAGVSLPIYRVFVVAVGVLVIVALLLTFGRTRLGAMVRAGVDDREMAEALGINVRRLFGGVFAVGAALAGLAGVLAVPIFNAYPGMGSEILISALVVVVVGGMGSLAGALIASLLIGAATVVGQVFAAEFSTAVIYLILVAVLLIRPQGIMGSVAR